MALLKLVLSSVLFVTALASVNQMDLTGFVGRAAPPCPVGQVCPTPGPITGQNITIWHCDGTCTYVFLWCHEDHFQLSFMPPAGAKETHVFALGGPGHQAIHSFAHKIRQCDSEQEGPEIVHPIDGRNPYPGTIHEKIHYDRCGTVSQASTEVLSSSVDREFLNELDLVEYLPAFPALTTNAVIHLVSHTQVNIKCCSGIPSVDNQCPPIRDQQRNLSECTEKSFTLQCESDVDNERYCCSLRSDAGADLDAANVGYYPQECRAVDIDGSKAYVSLFSNSRELQVEVGAIGANDQSIQYTIGGPWFQFDRPCTTLNPHRIQIECTVKLVPKAQLASYRPSGKVCSAGPQPRSAPGFFQAGQLTLLK